MGRKYGILALKQIVGTTLELASISEEVFGDGEFQWTETLKYLPVLRDIPKIISSLPAIPKELGDLDDEEAKELVDFVREEFDIDSDKIEETIEDSLELFLKIYQFSMKTGKRFQTKK